MSRFMLGSPLQTEQRTTQLIMIHLTAPQQVIMTNIIRIILLTRVVLVTGAILIIVVSIKFPLEITRYLSVSSIILRVVITFT